MPTPDKKISVLEAWKKKRGDAGPAHQIIPKAGGSGPFPLSPGQKQLFFLDQLYPNNPVYNFSEIYHFEGELDIPKLEESLGKVLRDNDILRCAFGIKNQETVQTVHENPSWELTKHDLRSLTKEEQSVKTGEIMDADLLQAFNLSKAPLLRTSLIMISKTTNILFLTLHHIITDKWSMGILRDQLAQNYYTKKTKDRDKANEIDIQFTDYASWIANKPVEKEHLDYWKSKLSGQIQVLPLPTDYPNPKVAPKRYHRRITYFQARFPATRKSNRFF